MVRTITEATSPGGEGQITSGPCEKIFGYTSRQLRAPLYRASEAERLSSEAASYSYRSLLSNLGEWKKCHKARFTSFYIHTPNT